MKKKQLPSMDDGISPALRRYLYFTATVTGAAILVVEILGAKMLSPYVGTSHFVWTAQIVVTLISLACGYYLGGWLVERSLRLSRLYTCILLAAIYLCFSIPACEPVALWALRYKLAVGSVLTSIFLFFAPLTLLAMTGPFLVRVLTASVVGVGGVVGRLSAVSTFGSVLGAALIGYVLIPFLPNSVNMFVTAGILMAVVIGYFAIWAHEMEWKAAVGSGVVIGVGLAFAGLRMESITRYQHWEELHKSNSNFGLLQVLQTKNGARRIYLNDYLIQNTYHPAEKQSLSMFTYMLHELARSYTRKIDNVLCIGLGIGIVPMQFAQEGAKVDVVEINPSVIEIARKYFDLQPEKLNIVLGDGRYFVNRSTQQYDVIVLDAFLGDSTPSHLMSREAFAGMGRVLQPEGVLVINCFGNLQPAKDFFTASIDKTLRAAFKSVRIHYSGNGNLFFVASGREDLRPIHQPDFSRIHRLIRPEVEEAYASTPQVSPDRGIILTDDYNPVEYYDAANREAIRRNLVLSRQRF